MSEITPLPDPPSTADSSNFATDADAFLAALPTFAAELNTFGGQLNNLSTSSTSVTSNTIGTGNKSFTVETGKSYRNGMSLTIARTAAPTNRMFAVVNSYNSGTGALVVTSQAFEGSGTHASWTITLGFNGIISNAQLGADARGVGCVIYIASNTAPTGYLKANGAAVSRATYSDLFATIGTTFGAGNGTTTFTLPDLRGEFIRGWDDGKGTDSGRVFGSSQLDSFQGHRHTLTDAGGTAVTIQAPTNAGAGGTGKYTVAGGTTDLARTEVTNGSNGTPRTSSETRPRNVALLACIKF